MEVDSQQGHLIIHPARIFHTGCQHLLTSPGAGTSTGEKEPPSMAQLHLLLRGPVMSRYRVGHPVVSEQYCKKCVCLVNHSKQNKTKAKVYEEAVYTQSVIF